MSLPSFKIRVRFLLMAALCYSGIKLLMAMTCDMVLYYIIIYYIILYCSEVKTESIKSLLCLFTLLERKQRHNNAGTRVTNKINILLSVVFLVFCY